MAVSTGMAMAGGALLGSGLLGGSRESGSTTATTVANSSPWAPTHPYWTGLFQQSNNTPINLPGLSDPAADQLRSTIHGDYLNPSTNPFFQNSVNDALGLAKSQFAGQYGGSAGSNLSNSGYQEMLARNLGQIATNAYANQYNRERALQIAAAGGAPGFDTMAGRAPFAPLKERAAILAAAGGGSSTSSQEQPYFTNPLAGALGGALAGGQIAGMLGGGAAPFFGVGQVPY